jgi:hypothetical protein
VSIPTSRGEITGVPTSTSAFSSPTSAPLGRLPNRNG